MLLKTQSWITSLGALVPVSATPPTLPPSAAERMNNKPIRFLISLCRYTFFFVLYPMGVTGELLTIYAALPTVQKTGLYSVTLPNKYNFSFDYYSFLILVMISYIPRKSIESNWKPNAWVCWCHTYYFHPPPSSLPPALLPHDTTEEEGAGPHRGLQQGGVSAAAFRKIQTRREETKTSTERGTKSRQRIKTQKHDQFSKCQTCPGRRSSFLSLFFFIFTTVIFRCSQNITNEQVFLLLFIYEQTTGNFCLVLDLAALKKLCFDSDAVELPAEHQ